MDFRHELKHEITTSDLAALRARLQVLMTPDSHGVNGRYQIRSLYFDTPADKALWEKRNGVDPMEKFRLRYYDGDLSVIRLEKKSRRNGLGSKVSAPLSPQEAQSIVDGARGWMAGCGRPLVEELYHKMAVQGLRPKTIVDYTREAFVYAPGNVRVTLDHHLRTGLQCVYFLNPDCVTVPAGDASAVLEVKWDTFLPDLIRDAVQLVGEEPPPSPNMQPAGATDDTADSERMVIL